MRSESTWKGDRLGKLVDADFLLPNAWIGIFYVPPISHCFCPQYILFDCAILFSGPVPWFGRDSSGFAAEIELEWSWTLVHGFWGRNGVDARKWGSDDGRGERDMLEGWEAFQMNFKATGRPFTGEIGVRNERVLLLPPMEHDCHMWLKAMVAHVCDHSWETAPDPVRSRKLSSYAIGKYLEGRPPGKTG